MIPRYRKHRRASDGQEKATGQQLPALQDKAELPGSDGATNGILAGQGGPWPKAELGSGAQLMTRPSINRRPVPEADGNPRSELASGTLNGEEQAGTARRSLYEMG